MLSFLSSHAAAGLDSTPKTHVGLAILAQENFSYESFFQPWKSNIFSLTEERDVNGIYNWKDAVPRVRRPWLEY